MLIFILKRIGLAIPTLLVILAIVFWAARLTPSDPVDIIAGEKASPATKASMRHQYGLDQPDRRTVRALCDGHRAAWRFWTRVQVP